MPKPFDSRDATCGTRPGAGGKSAVFISPAEDKLLRRLRGLAAGCYFAWLEKGENGISLVLFNEQPRKKEVIAG